MPLIPTAAPAGPAVIAALVTPARPFVEERGSGRRVNFDVLLHNASGQALRLVAIREQVYGPDGALDSAREVNANGKPPALSGLGDLMLAPGAYKDVPQPFWDFTDARAGSRIRLLFVFLRPDRPVPPVALQGDALAEVEVTPRAYRAEPYCLPLAGRLLVHDGHDFYSHHRRRDLAASAKGDPTRNVNANLYAYDVVRIDRDGALFHGSPDRKEDWLTFGEPILSPVDGVVAEAVDGVPDNRFANGEAITPPEAVAIDPEGLGDHVLIRAADGRVSWLLHMEPGSVRVKTGDRVRSGQELGRVGFSGDSLFPHLHFTVTADAAHPSQGVPSYFKAFARAGDGGGDGQIDSGDIIKASGACRAP